MKQYDVMIIGAGPGGIFSAYEMVKLNSSLKIAVLEAGHVLEKRICPIDGKKIKSCINCDTCAIMRGFGGAGAFSDGKYNITNDFGGTLHEYIGWDTAIELMEYVDEINCSHGGAKTKMYSTADSPMKKKCMQNKLKLLDAQVRHLGTDINYIVLGNLYEELKDKVDFYFDTKIEKIEKLETGYRVSNDEVSFEGEKCIISVGRSGSKWMETVCDELDIPTKSNRVDLGVRVELPAVIFEDITDELYEGKIVLVKFVVFNSKRQQLFYLKFRKTRKGLFQFHLERLLNFDGLAFSILSVGNEVVYYLFNLAYSRRTHLDDSGKLLQFWWNLQLTINDHHLDSIFV